MKTILLVTVHILRCHFVNVLGSLESSPPFAQLATARHWHWLVHYDTRLCPL